DGHGKLISQINTYRAGKMIKAGSISGGMIPKVKSGLYALKKGVKTVHVIDGRIPHAILLELFTDHGIGTMVVK
ncbi:MAG: acetylglutamate kinase, partial [Candidatus Margulisbacteria bacterium]|nr:acetylglutamate kinase [Candidatus Margulisiibacteriota bacterium]